MGSRGLIKVLVLNILLISPIASYAQQESQYAQYTVNTMLINPAYAGGRGRFSVLALYKNQWTGIRDAPTTISLSADSPLGRTGRSGIGVEFFKDEFGPSIQSKIAGNFSYIIPINQSVYFGFGIKAGLEDFYIDENKLTIYDYDGLVMEFRREFNPIVGAGGYIYGEKWYIGFSTPNLLETHYFGAAKISTVSRRVHLYAISGYNIQIGEYFILKPTTLIKAVRGAPLAIDLSLNSLFFDRIALGLAYRTSAAIGVLGGFQINDHFMMGYAYDYSATRLAKYNQGSHEVFLRFELSPRSQWKNVKLKTIF